MRYAVLVLVFAGASYGQEIKFFVPDVNPHPGAATVVNGELVPVTIQPLPEELRLVNTQGKEPGQVSNFNPWDGSWMVQRRSGGLYGTVDGDGIIVRNGMIA